MHFQVKILFLTYSLLVYRCNKLVFQEKFLAIQFDLIAMSESFLQVVKHPFLMVTLPPCLATNYAGYIYLFFVCFCFWYFYA